MPSEPPKLKLTPTTTALALLAGLLLTLVEIEALEYTWNHLGIPHRWFFTLLVGCLLGSMVNLPILSLPTEGTEGSRMLVAINLGGALVPVGISLYLLEGKPAAVSPGLIATAVVAAISFLTARPMKGIGIAMPILVGPLVAAGCAMVLAPASPAPVAFIGGTLGTLIGADLLNLGRIRSLGAPVVSIGGAGTFDGVFLSGLLAVLLS